MQLKPEFPLAPALSPEERENVSHVTVWLTLQWPSQRGDIRLSPGGEICGDCVRFTVAQGFFSFLNHPILSIQLILSNEIRLIEARQLALEAQVTTVRSCKFSRANPRDPWSEFSREPHSSPP